MSHHMAYSSEHWRLRAAYARFLVYHLPGPHAKVAMMDLAVSYEMLAVQAQQRELAAKLARYKDH